jgi:hypothetical protein
MAALPAGPKEAEEDEKRPDPQANAAHKMILGVAAEASNPVRRGRPERRHRRRSCTRAVTRRSAQAATNCYQQDYANAEPYTPLRQTTDLPSVRRCGGLGARRSAGIEVPSDLGGGLYGSARAKQGTRATWSPATGKWGLARPPAGMRDVFLRRVLSGVTRLLSDHA